MTESDHSTCSKGNFFYRMLCLVKDKILIQMFLVILICLFASPIISVKTISYFYAISLTLKSILIFILPLLIGGAIASAFAKIPKGGFVFTICVLLGLTFSNFLNMSIAYFIGKAVVQDSGISNITISSIEKISPAFNINLMDMISPEVKKFYNNGYALILGLIIGVSCSIFSLSKVEHYANTLNKAMMFFMSKIFTRILPIFIAGFLLKMLREGELKQMFENQLFATLSVILLIFSYLAIWLVIASGFRLARLKEIFFNILPAMITAFSTMSSAATLPLALEAAEKNTKDPLLSRSLIPMIMNFHMMGSSMAVSVAALIIMSCFQVPFPDYSHFAIFGMYFCLNKFAGAGVPAGSIIVTLPFFKSILGFTDDMVGLILAFYIVFDPIITLGNVAANNIFVIFTQKTIRFFSKKKEA
jgi:Na+/H+-dicarboxylate symporter